MIGYLRLPLSIGTDRRPFVPQKETLIRAAAWSASCQKATSRSLFEDDGETVLRAVVKNLVILLPNEERSACDPFGGLRETHLRWVLDIFDRDRHAEMVIFPFTVLASDMENASSVNPVGALH